MTEDEAKTKTCCGPRAAGFADIECIASACMAWRWAAQPHRARRLNPNLPSPFDRAGDGYCGLAGAPQ